jgi:hypothetical protein
MTAAFHGQVLVFIDFDEDGAFFTKASPRLVARPSRTVGGVPCTDLSTIDVDKALFLIGTRPYALFISPA